jgi:hypothetical protein
MRPTDVGFLMNPLDGPDFRITMLTVPDQQAAAEHPRLRQSEVRLELTPADSSPALPLSLLLGDAPTPGVGGTTRPS